MDLISGHSRPAYELAAQLLANGHSVRILSTKLGPVRQQRHRTRRRREGYLSLPPTERVFGSGRDLLAPNRRQRKSLAAIGEWAELVHGFSLWSTGLLRSRLPVDLPVVLSLNTLPRPPWGDFGSFGRLAEFVLMRRSALVGRVMPRSLLSALVRRFDRLIAWTEFLRDEYMAAGVPAGIICRVPVGVDLRRLPEPAPSAGGPVQLLYFGLLTPTRGAAEAVRAFVHLRERVPSASLVIADRGHHKRSDRGYLARQRARLLELVERLGVAGSCQLRGFEADIHGLIAAASVIVLPFNSAIGYSHPPLTALEALAMGKPVVSTTIGSMPEILGKPNLGMLVPPGQTEALASAIEKVWREDGPARQRARRQWVEEQHDWGQAADQLMAEYETVIAGRRG